MKSLLKALQIALRKKFGPYVLFGSIFLLFITILLLEKAPTLMGVFSLDFSFLEKATLLFTYLFDLRSSFTTSSLILITLGSVLGGINLTFAYTYFTARTKVLLHSNLYSGTGLFLAFLGIGCAACGTALLSTLLGLFGLSFVLGFLPYQGLEIGYFGLFILGLATLSLAKKVAAPNVC